jgi:hypothetical protein
VKSIGNVLIFLSFLFGVGDHGKIGKPAWGESPRKRPVDKTEQKVEEIKLYKLVV